MQTLIRSFQVQRSVLFALLLRELKTRFGQYRLGYAWVLLEPAAHIGILVAIMGVRSIAQKYPGVDTPVFLLSGIVPFFMFRHVVMQISNAVDANQGLFNYRHVKPMDTIIARFLLEGIIYTLVYVVLLFVAFLSGLHTAVRDPLGLIGLYLVLYIFSFALGVFFAVLGSMYEESKKIFSIIMQPLYFISAVMFPMNIVPMQYRDWLMWNPLVHIMELSRSRFFASFHSPVGSLFYVIACTGILLFISLSLFWVKRKEMVAS